MGKLCGESGSSGWSGRSDLKSAFGACLTMRCEGVAPIVGSQTASSRSRRPVQVRCASKIGLNWPQETFHTSRKRTVSRACLKSCHTTFLKIFCQIVCQNIGEACLSLEGTRACGCMLVREWLLTLCECWHVYMYVMYILCLVHARHAIIMVWK